MADYNLHGLNPRDFQHLVQAIARKKIASGVTAFGDGKDGARDLSYRGKMDYPSVSTAWDGYLILGCKFHQQPSQNRKQDGDWAIQQLEKDLKKFLSRKRGLLKPEYYLFVTNISLTGVAEKGSRDRVEHIFREYLPKLKLKDYGVWDYNDLRGFLDGDAEIRAAYGHFITAGDVLSNMMGFLKPQRSDFLDVMHSFLQKELIADTSAKLQAAGEDPELQIPLANVFVDLPFAKTAEAATLEKVDKDAKVIRTMLEAGSFVLRRNVQEEDSLVRSEGRLIAPRVSRFVIVGGPGQGKSTLAQYLCQLYRSALLTHRPASCLDERVSRIVRQLEKQKNEFGGLPAARRFPVRIELRTFSQALVNDPGLTLMEHIRQDISRLGSAAVSTEDLKKWLGQYPWLLFLDGLDEVPPSSNRREVMTQIEHFRIDAATQNADLMIVATTRPQSYTKEFSEDLFRHLYLVPMTPRQALQYGRKLAEARCGDDERRKEELVNSLEKACKNEATARLMQSPLQVTIMATLLEDTGEPPQQRYRLFAEYYRTIYRRETRRRLLGGILSERQTDIDMIHSHAGLVLHAAGETVSKRLSKYESDDSEAALSDEEFRNLVRRRLNRIKVPPLKAAELLDRISDGSLQRLVFLVRPREGWVCFDITSLKEFMAAEAIMSGPDDDVRRRLETLGPATYWRNVFLFAVGKCFVEREHMLDMIVSLCAGLNEERVASRILDDEIAGQAAKIVLWGSRLALDILADGTARQYPEYELRLIKTAMELVKYGDVEASARLAAIYHDDLQNCYRSAVADRLGHANFWSQVGGWYVLMGLAERDVYWAIEELNTKWPNDVTQQRVLLYGRGPVARSKWWLAKWIELAPKLSPHYSSHYLLERIAYGQEKLFPEPWDTIHNFVTRHHRSLEISNRSTWADVITSFSLTPSHIGPEFRKAMTAVKFEHNDWVPYIAAARFGDVPSAKSLAQELQWLSIHWDPVQGARVWNMPWPLAACLFDARSKEDLAQKADLVSSGKLGDIKDWQEAEKRWRHHGVNEDDISAISDQSWPFDSNIVRVGFPLGAWGWSTRSSGKVVELQSLLSKLHSLPNGKLKAWLASIIVDLLSSHGRFRWLGLPSGKDLRELLTLAIPMRDYSWFDFEELFSRVLRNGVSSEWIEFFDWLGRQDYVFVFSEEAPWIESLIHHFCAEPDDKTGLLPVIAAAAGPTKCKLPRAVLNAISAWTGKARRNAILLTVARDDLTSDELRNLAKEVASRKPEETSPWRLLHVASLASVKQGATLAIALLNQSLSDSEEAADIKQAAHRNLIEYLTKKPSNLGAPGTWADLHLPDRL